MEEESVWVYPPKQFGRTSARALAASWQVLAAPEEHGYPPSAAARCLAITSRHLLQNGFARHLPWSMYAADFGTTPPLRVWSKGGSYPSVQCEAGLFETEAGRWVLAAMLDDLADPRTGAASPSSTAIAEIARLVWERWR